MRISVLFFTLLHFTFSPLFSQNYLYNSEQFGLQGSMLGGAVVAGSEDESMTFYNPASIFKAPEQVSISLLQPEYKNFGFKEFWGANEVSELNTDLDLKPSLLAFKFKVKDLDITFLKISRSNLTDEFSAKRELTTANNFKTAQYFDYQYTGKDSWFGFGTSISVAKNMYVGISQFLSIADYTYNNEILLERFDLSSVNPSENYFNSVLNGRYRNTAFITKLGFLYDTKKHDFGVTITTPAYFRITKSGNVKSTVVVIDDTQNSGVQIINNDLSPIIKTPWEVSLGYSYMFETQSKLWVATDFHSRISEYEMARVQSVGTSFPWMNGSKSVLNLSVGYSHKLTSDLELSGAFRTNQFAYENKRNDMNTLRNTILDGNHLHFVVGSKFKLGRHNILLGLDWGTLIDAPNEEAFDNISNIGRLSPNLRGLTKNSFSLLFTYGFILDGFKKIAN